MLSSSSVVAAMLVVVVASEWTGSTPLFNVSWIPGLTIITSDNLTLHADCTVPHSSLTGSQLAGRLFPIVIMPNSWAAVETEYLPKAMEWGQQGYIMCEYQTRGFYQSGGEVDMAGPLDQRDISSVIDALLHYSTSFGWKANNSAIGFLGISYGAGLSLLAAGVDARVTAVVAMSGWTNLSRALYDQETPSLAYTSALILMADMVGRVIPEMKEMWEDMLTHRNVSRLHAFCDIRSPLFYLEAINERRVPIFLSNNYMDRLFRPQHNIDFYELLEGPKFILLNQGLHADPESKSLPYGKDNMIWSQAKRWMDQFLQNKASGIRDEPPMQLQVHGTDMYKHLWSWPDFNASELVTMRLGSQKSPSPLGTLTTSSFNAGGPPNNLSFSLSPSVGTGTYPIVSDYLAEDGNDPVTLDLLLVDPSSALVFLTDTPMQDNITICGTSLLTIPRIAASGPYWQLYGYLYDVDEWYVGKLIADAYWTCWANCPRPKQELEFRTICRTVVAGHRLAVGVSLYENLYQPADNSTHLSVLLSYENATFTFTASTQH